MYSKTVTQPRSARLGVTPFALLVTISISLAVAAPIVIVWIESFAIAEEGFENFIRIVTRESFVRVIYNTVLFVSATVPAAVVVGVVLALIIERTDAPIPRRIARVLPLGSLLVPPLVGALGWVFLFAPDTGVFTALLTVAGLPGASIYTLPGVLMAGSIFLVPYSYSFASSALQSLDGSHEEAARMSGASAFRTLLAVTIPLIRPALTGALVVVTMMSLAEFSIPLLIGGPMGFSVVTVEIYRSIQGQYPSDYFTASVLALSITIVSLVGIVLQRKALKTGGYAVVTGKGSPVTKVKLGRLRYPCAIVVWMYVSFAVVFPVLAVIYVSFMRLWRGKIADVVFTIENFSGLIATDRFTSALTNSFLTAFLSATAVAVISVLCAYIIVVRRKLRTSVVLDYMTNLPLGIPSIVFGLGLLLIYLRLGSLYGTLASLVIAYVVLTLPHGVRLISSGIRQLGSELEEAARVAGASAFGGLFRIIVPLIMPAIRLAWILVFVLSFRELSASVLISTGRTRVVSSVMVDIFQSGTYTQLAAFAVVVVAINMIALAIATIRISVGSRLRASWSSVRSSPPPKNGERR